MDKQGYDEFIKDFEKYINSMSDEEFEQFCNAVGVVNIEASTDSDDKVK